MVDAQGGQVEHAVGAAGKRETEALEAVDTDAQDSFGGVAAGPAEDLRGPSGTSPARDGTEPCEPTLALAVWKGKLPDVRLLLRQRADPNALEPHAEGNMSHTPLMAAAANGSVGIAAALLVAGAYPDTQTPAGVAAADLTNNPDIGKMLALFNAELEAEIRGVDAPSSDAAARDEAMKRLQSRAPLLVEKALQRGVAITDLLPKGDAGVTGADARKARKLRLEEREAARLQRVAQKAAARRQAEAEEARLQRIAQKAAARRQARLERAEQSPSGEDESTDSEERRRRKKKKKEKKRKKRRDSDEEPQHNKHQECFQCTSCGQSGERKACGMCGHIGVCGVCSMCGVCGNLSGFCTTPSVAAIPGMCGMTGLPEMSGLASIEEAFVNPESLRRRSSSRSSMSHRKKKKRGARNRPPKQARSDSRGFSNERSRSRPRRPHGGNRSRSRSPVRGSTAGKRNRKSRAGERGADQEQSQSRSQTRSRSRSESGRGRRGHCEYMEQEQEYYADNRELGAATQGMGYRRSKDYNDTLYDVNKFVEWGTVVRGIDEGDGWLKVGKLYLPMYLGGKLVLTIKSDDTPSQHRSHRSASRQRN